MVDEFYRKTGRHYSKKQLKIKWDNMKQDWTLFKQLMRGDTGLGWDATKNTIMADDDWWDQKLRYNSRIVDIRYKRLRNKDLSHIWFHYDALISDIVATGERARAANQEQMPEIGADLDEERAKCDDLQEMDSLMFPKPSLKRQISTDSIGISSPVKKSKTKSAASSMKEEMHSLVELMSGKSIATSHAVDDPPIDKCIDMLSSIPEISSGTEMYNYIVNMLLKKDIRQVFLKMPSDEARKSWLEYNYELYLMKKM
ncbi:unnamed protein product [Withania somnifera]